MITKYLIDNAYQLLINLCISCSFYYGIISTKYLEGDGPLPIFVRPCER